MKQFPHNIRACGVGADGNAGHTEEGLFCGALTEWSGSELEFPLPWVSYPVLCVPLSLQRKLPADSKVLEASDLVYTVSAHEYWQQALLTEEETGIFFFLSRSLKFLSLSLAL